MGVVSAFVVIEGEPEGRCTVGVEPMNSRLLNLWGGVPPLLLYVCAVDWLRWVDAHLFVVLLKPVAKQPASYGF